MLHSFRSHVSVWMNDRIWSKVSAGTSCMVIDDSEDPGVAVRAKGPKREGDPRDVDTLVPKISRKRWIDTHTIITINTARRDDKAKQEMVVKRKKQLTFDRAHNKNRHALKTISSRRISTFCDPSSWQYWRISFNNSEGVMRLAFSMLFPSALPESALLRAEDRPNPRNTDASNGKYSNSTRTRRQSPKTNLSYSAKTKIGTREWQSVATKMHDFLTRRSQASRSGQFECGWASMLQNKFFIRSTSTNSHFDFALRYRWPTRMDYERSIGRPIHQRGTNTIRSIYNEH